MPETYKPTQAPRKDDNGLTPTIPGGTQRVACHNFEVVFPFSLPSLSHCSSHGTLNFICSAGVGTWILWWSQTAYVVLPSSLVIQPLMYAVCLPTW